MKEEEFYSRGVDLNKATQELNHLLNTCTLNEIFWIIRNISYDQVAYYSDNDKGIIYRDPEYSKLNREQACILQRQLSAMCDLLCQSIVDKREFDEGYLKGYYFLGPYLSVLEEKDKRIKQLEEAISNASSVL